MSTTYIEPIDCEKFFENFCQYYYGADAAGTTAFDSDAAYHFRRINDKLRLIDSVPDVPIGTLDDTGSYPEGVKELQARRLIYTKIIARDGGGFGDELPDWVQIHIDAFNEILEEIQQGNIAFSNQITTRSVGVGPATIATQVGRAKFYTSNGYNQFSYLGSDYTRKYRIEIDGTTGGNKPGKASFKWSRDNGQSYVWTQVDTGTQWVHLEDNVYIRWESLSLTGTQKQIEHGDAWTFEAVPESLEHLAGEDVVAIRTLGRG